MSYILVAALILLVISYAVLGGLVYYVIQLSKESSIDKSGVMMMKGTDQPVQVGSADFKVVDGVFTSQGKTCTDGSCPNPSGAIQTSQVQHHKAPLFPA